LEEASKVNLTRAALYSFLSRAFKAEVNELFLDDVIAAEPTIRSLTDSQGGEELREGSKLLREFTDQVKSLKSNDKEMEAFLVNLASEYASLSGSGH